jgi:hypothetical protein
MFQKWNRLYQLDEFFVVVAGGEVVTCVVLNW